MVSFKNTIIIMTSNLGSGDILDAEGNREAMRNMVMSAVGGPARSGAWAVWV